MIISGLHMLDTNIATYILSGRSPDARNVYRQAVEHGRVAVSSITQAEILFGLEKKFASTRLRSAIDRFLDSVEILPWDSAAAVAYATLRARMQVGGRSLSGLDMLIAAHAVSVGAILVTHDLAFRYAAPLLDVTDWATDL